MGWTQPQDPTEQLRADETSEETALRQYREYMCHSPEPSDDSSGQSAFLQLSEYQCWMEAAQPLTVRLQIDSPEIEIADMDSRPYQGNPGKHMYLQVLRVPAGQRLYRGCTYAQPQSFSMPTYFSDIKTAAWYAFSNEWRDPSKGVLKSYRATEDCYLIDADCRHNFEMLEQLADFTVDAHDDPLWPGMNLLTYCYGYHGQLPELRRCSEMRFDRLLVNKLAEVMSPFPYIHGIASRSFPELCLFSPRVAPSKITYRLHTISKALSGSSEYVIGKYRRGALVSRFSVPLAQPVPPAFPDAESVPEKPHISF